jgi:hypothetical protein
MTVNVAATTPGHHRLFDHDVEVVQPVFQHRHRTRQRDAYHRDDDQRSPEQLAKYRAAATGKQRPNDQRAGHHHR